VEAHRIGRSQRLPHFPEKLLRDGGDVSLTCQPPFTPKNIPGAHFCWRLSLPQGHSATGRIRSIEKSKSYENKMKRNIFRPMKDEVTKAWR
jgi:hypothetical protein